jgi:hypothetical protein
LQLSGERLDWVNIGLMIAAAAVAVIAPFHLFLFSYAFLGPLHYLTEISWLHDRGFFTPRRGARITLLLLVAFVSMLMLFGYVSTELLHHYVAPTWEIGLFLLVFATAAIVQYTRHPVNAAVLVLVAGAGLAAASGYATYGILAYLLITVIHVFVFTGAFLLQGAARSRSRAGYLSFITFIVAAIAVLLLPLDYAVPAGRVRVVYAAFEQLNVVLLQLLGRSSGIYERGSVGVMRFIAYAYTYHYLNWFSKTSLIRWHAVGRLRASIVFGLWLVGMAVYLFSYQAGFALFYILSAAHVMLEFPLNHQTFVTLSRAAIPARWQRPRTA